MAVIQNSLFPWKWLQPQRRNTPSLSPDLKKDRNRLMMLLLKKKEGVDPERQEQADIIDIVDRLAASNLIFVEAKLGGGPWEVCRYAIIYILQARLMPRP